jgi:diguanylate cyclase (GGDEF)-like protein/PAS domain S-box-containing protein
MGIEMNQSSVAEDFSTLFFEYSKDMFIIFDDDGVLQYANVSVSSVTDYSRQDLAGFSIHNFVHPDDREDFFLQQEEVYRSRTGTTFTLRLKTRTGTVLWCSCYLYYHSRNNCYHALLQNITDHITAAERMVQREERLKILVDNVNEYLYSVQYRDGMFVDTFHNRQCEKITGYSALEFAENHDLWYTMIHKDDRQLVIDNLEAIKKTKKTFYIEHRITHKSGEVRWISNSCVAVINDYEKKYQYIGFILDITDKKNREHELYNHATYDELTGIYNRRAGIKALERCITKSYRSSSPCTICYFDINNLKEVNDHLGHASGDDMLKTAVSIVKDELRSSDAFTRLGGDEFLLIFPNTSLSETRIIVHRIINAIIAFNDERKKAYRLYVSYGFSEYAPHTSGPYVTPEQLINRADKEMYYYKEKSRQQFRTAMVSH